jgi:hypothetical protein
MLLLLKCHMQTTLEVYQMAVVTVTIQLPYISICDGQLAKSETCQMYRWRLVCVNRVTDTALLDRWYCAVLFMLNWNVFICKCGSGLHICRDCRHASLLWPCTHEACYLYKEQGAFLWLFNSTCKNVHQYSLDPMGKGHICSCHRWLKETQSSAYSELEARILTHAADSPATSMRQTAAVEGVPHSIV